MIVVPWVLSARGDEVGRPSADLSRRAMPLAEPRRPSAQALQRTIP